MTAQVLPFPSRRAIKSGEEVVRRNGAAGEGTEPGHVTSARLATAALPVVPDLADGTDGGSRGIQGQALCLSPRSEWMLSLHKSDSKRIAYPLTSRRKRLTGSFVSADILLFATMQSAPNRIRELRAAAQLSQEQLGERVGVHKMTISDLERGNIELTLTYMRRLSKALSVEIDELFSEVDHPGRASSEERELIEAFRSSPENARSYILASAKAVAGPPDVERKAA